MTLPVSIIGWLHVFFAMVWVGSAILFPAVLGPVIGGLSPQSRSEFLLRFLPRMERFLNVTVPLLLASGVALAGTMTDWNLHTLFGGGVWGLLVVTGGALGLLTYVFALATFVPAGRRMSNALKRMQTAPTRELGDELARIQRAIKRASEIEIALMLVTLAFMTAAGFGA
ncbi:MAG: hypothetical protein JRN45_00420 [Nitrososphaerota archaeon]|nr:hypothetical protein [Nitrososphaerota archaeon]